MASAFEKLCRLAGSAIVRYHMIEDGDRILAGLSGGKDSMVMLLLLKHFMEAAPVHFTVEAVTFDPGFPGFSAEETADFCRKQEIPHHIIRFDVPALLEEKQMEEKPCMLCSRLRRGNLYALAEKLHCGSIALGQHLDDIIVSFLMSVCHGSGLSTMGPNIPAKGHPVRVIRPMICAPESLIEETSLELELPRHGECLYKEHLQQKGDRAYFRQMTDVLAQRIPDLRSNFLRSLSNIQEDYLLDERFLCSGKNGTPQK